MAFKINIKFLYKKFNKKNTLLIKYFLITLYLIGSTAISKKIIAGHNSTIWFLDIFFGAFQEAVIHPKLAA